MFWFVFWPNRRRLSLLFNPPFLFFICPPPREAGKRWLKMEACDWVCSAADGVEAKRGPGRQPGAFWKFFSPPQPHRPSPLCVVRRRLPRTDRLPSAMVAVTWRAYGPTELVRDPGGGARKASSTTAFTFAGVFGSCFDARIYVRRGVWKGEAFEDTVFGKLLQKKNKTHSHDWHRRGLRRGSNCPGFVLFFLLSALSLLWESTKSRCADAAASAIVGGKKNSHRIVHFKTSRSSFFSPSIVLNLAGLMRSASFVHTWQPTRTPTWGGKQMDLVQQHSIRSCWKCGLSHWLLLNSFQDALETSAPFCYSHHDLLLLTTTGPVVVIFTGSGSPAMCFAQSSTIF